MILVNKRMGETPLEAINRVQRSGGLKYKKLAYAGRLDPMAEGLLLIMTDDECKNRKNFQLLDKEYRIRVLFGVQTDSWDILGLVKEDSFNIRINKTKILKTLALMQAGYRMTFPLYSAKRIKGKPLYYYALRGMLDEKSLPHAEKRIRKIVFHRLFRIKRDWLENYIFTGITKVRGNFRQKEIISSWERFFQVNRKRLFEVLEMTILCESGTFMRSLAFQLGQELGVSSLALSIVRKKIGSYSLKEIKPGRHGFMEKSV